MNKIKLVHELDTQTRSLAVAAYAAAHGSAPDFGFAPDRGWVEGWAYAQTAAPAPAAVAVPDWLRQMEWVVSNYDRAGEFRRWCPNCGGCQTDYRDGRAGHKDGCELAAALSTTPPAQAQDVQRDAELIEFIEAQRDVRFSRCREGSINGPIRWDVEMGHHGVEVRAPTLAEAIRKAIAASAALGEA